MLTQDRLKEVLHYDPETGIFSWKERLVKFRHAGKQCSATNNRGYIVIGIDGFVYLAHRIAWIYMHGYLPKFIDHKNRDRKDNRICNLRIASRTENNRNKKIHSNNSSGFNGVYFRKDTKRWEAYICSSSRKISLGCFDEIEDAVAARVRANFEYGYSDGHGTI